MADFNRNFTTSPVLVMSSQSAHQSPFGTSAFAHQKPSFSSFSVFGSNASLPQSYVSPSASERRGRKRSRDEASENLDERVSATSDQFKKSEESWVYDSDMVLKPGSGYVSEAGSRPGTWVEKINAEGTKGAEAATLTARHHEQERPLRSHKSQRLDLGSALLPCDLCSNRSSPSRPVNSITPTASISLDATSTPIIDDFTLTFGIGWRLMTANSSISPAVRGWARYIENHYPITNVSVEAESKSLESYLVKANEGWFLFNENLRQGRLVSIDSQRCIDNLRSSPPVFEGTETLIASSSPKTVSPFPLANDVEMD